MASRLGAWPSVLDFLDHAGTRLKTWFLGLREGNTSNLHAYHQKPELSDINLAADRPTSYPYSESHPGVRLGGNTAPRIELQAPERTYHRGAIFHAPAPAPSSASLSSLSPIPLAPALKPRSKRQDIPVNSITIGTPNTKEHTLIRLLIGIVGNGLCENTAASIARPGHYAYLNFLPFVQTLSQVGPDNLFWELATKLTASEFYAFIVHHRQPDNSSYCSMLSAIASSYGFMNQAARKRFKNVIEKYKIIVETVVRHLSEVYDDIEVRHQADDGCEQCASASSLAAGRAQVDAEDEMVLTRCRTLFSGLGAGDRVSDFDVHKFTWLEYRLCRILYGASAEAWFAARGDAPWTRLSLVNLENSINKVMPNSGVDPVVCIVMLGILSEALKTPVRRVGGFKKAVDIDIVQIKEHINLDDSH